MTISILRALLPSVGLFIAALVCAMITIHRRRLRNSKYFQGTGPKSWPIVGAAWELGCNYHRMHDWLLSYFEKNSTISANLPGRHRSYFTVDIANVKYMLKTNFRNFPKGDEFHEVLEVLLGDGIFNTDGEQWKRQRKTASVEFSMRCLRDFNAVVFKEKALNLAHLLLQIQQLGVPIDMQDLFMRMTLDSIGKVGFGVEFNSLPSELPLPDNTFAKAFDKANDIVTRRFVDPLWKIKRALGICQESELARNMEVLNKFTYNVIKKRTIDMISTDANLNQPTATGCSPLAPLKLDLITRFISELNNKDGEKDGSKTKVLRDSVLNFVIAGRDTTAVTLSWFVFSITEKPEVAGRLYDELVAFERERNLSELQLNAADDATTEEDFLKIQEFSKLLTFDSLKAEELPYLQATITETLRLFPAVPLDPKGILKDDVLPDGTPLKKGGMIAYSPYCMARLSSIWGADAKEFKPERWLHNGKFQSESEFKFATFQAGPRTCLGKDFAYLQLKITAAILCRFFQFRRIPGHRVSYRMMTTLSMATGLQVHLMRRLF